MRVPNYRCKISEQVVMTKVLIHTDSHCRVPCHIDAFIKCQCKVWYSSR